MKTFLQTLIVAAAFLIQTNFVQGQYTYQTAKRSAFFGIFYLLTDSNNILQPGVETGCALVTSNPTWLVFGACGSGNTSFQASAYDNINSLFLDTLSLVYYGPFTDTVNLASKLINANIDTCMNKFGASSITWIYNLLNYQRGNIYVVLITSSHTVGNMIIDCWGPPFLESDTFFCPFCNSKLSELYQPICTITCDSVSQKNKLIWTKDIFTPAQDYVIFRKNTAGTYDTLGFQSISQLSEYVDVTSSPQAKSYDYKLGIRDSCGQFMNKGNNLYSVFTTMHLIVYPAGNNTANLSWNKGSYYTAPFYIYRTDPAGNTTLIDSIGIGTDPQTYTDLNAPAGFCSYQIGVNMNPPCVSSLLSGYNIVKSNPGYVTVTGINELADLSKAITIEPNPFNQFTKIDLHLFTKQNLKVVLRNVTGQTLMQYDDVKTNELIIEKNNLSQGLYFLEVTGEGFYGRKKLVVQ